MSAFGRRNGISGNTGGGKPSFGVARPMKSSEETGGSAAPLPVPMPMGGDQFPPLPTMDPSDSPVSAAALKADALTRLADRANGVSEGNYQAEGFEASVHKIKEQVLPRLLERVDP